MNKKLTIGLFGFGVVGEGIYKVLKNTPSLNASIKKICIKHLDKHRDAPSELFTTDIADIISDPGINLIVELIDDPVVAFKIVSSALANNKAVVSANKKMIADNLQDLLKLQKQFNVPFLYEAAVCGSIPIIRNLEEYYDNDMLKGICGIVNGSTNFILTKIIEEKCVFSEALREAQNLGFAESDPSLDVSGKDSVNKLTILLLHAYGIKTSPDNLLTRGITSVHSNDAVFAAEKGYKIKLIARAHTVGNSTVVAYVLPQFVKTESHLYNISNEFNGIVIESKLADKQFLCGKGAGRYPTSSAVLSDIAALRYNYQYEYRKLLNNTSLSLFSDVYLRVYVSFEDWNQIRKWDFESIDEYYSSESRQHLVGLIHFEKLREANWFSDDNVSIIAMPECIIEKEEIIKKNLKKISLQLAGV